MSNNKIIFKISGKNNSEFFLDDLISIEHDIESYGYDMTHLAKIGKIKPIYCREKEIKRVIEILCRKKKNNPILVGDAGVGKTAIVEGLAYLIAHNNVNKKLSDKKIFNLNLTSLISGTSYRGEFEERVDNILKNIIKSKDVILFIDEIHMMVGSGAVSSNDSFDLSNILKPYISNSDIQIIGATTYDEYKKYIEVDAALERRFQKIIINQMSPDDTIKLLYNIKGQYEDYHNVIYTDDAIKYCVFLSDRYINNRHFPDKAIDVMDEAGARMNVLKNRYKPQYIKLKNELNNILIKKNEYLLEKRFEEASNMRVEEKKILDKLKKIENNNTDSNTKNVVDIKNIIEVVSDISNIPIKLEDLNEIKKIDSIAKKINTHIFGQNKAVDTVINCIKRNKMGFNEPNKPTASFMFIGPSGVGKTYLAELLSEYIFYSIDNLIKIDMSEYYDVHTVSKLFGAPPGYVGYDRGGYLTELVNKKPYSIILFSDIDKCNKNVYNVFNQILNDGYVVNSYGKKTDFRNTIVIFTSNININEQNVGFALKKGNESIKNMNDVYDKLNAYFPQDFLNTLDEIVIFDALDYNSIIKIIKKEIDLLSEKMNKNNYTIRYTNALIENVYKYGYNKNHGVRSIKRYVKNNITDLVINKLMNLKSDDKRIIEIKIDGNDNISIEFVHK